MIESPTRELIRANQEDAEDPRGVEGWVAVKTTLPCTCGKFIGFVSVAHIPACWEPGDPWLTSFVTGASDYVIVDAPPDAVPFHVLSQFYEPHRPNERHPR